MPQIRSLRTLWLTLFAVGPLPAQVSVTIASNPTGAAFTVGGTGCAAGVYNTPQTSSWTAGSSCTILFTSPQYPNVGTQYVFTGWQDGATSNPRTITAPAQDTTYTANLNILYYLTTVSNPAQGGTVPGAGWYPANSSANLTAIPASGYRFLQWIGPASLVASGTTATVSVTVPGETVQANFAPSLPVPPNTYVVTQISANRMFSAVGIDNFGQVIGNTHTTPGKAFLWTPTAANGTTGSLIDLGSLSVNGTPSSVATGINDQGQVVGTIGIAPAGTHEAFLWQPTAPNAASGSMLSFLDPAASVSSEATGINNFGQIAGFERTPDVSFIWTPTAANGTTGTVKTDSQFDIPTWINGLGQLAMNGTTSSGNPQAFLFTPSAAQGATGTFTQLGPEMSQTAGLNNAGAVLVAAYSPCLRGPCASSASIWTPTSPNASTGNAVNIRLPSGFIGISAKTLNSNGQTVGNLIPSSGDVRTPFLYSHGSLYDLGTLSNFPGGNVVAINDRGQIIVNADGGGAYLLTPQAAVPPAPSASNPQWGSGAGATMTFTFTDPRGWQDLEVVNVLINNFIDGRNACYLAYSVPAGTLYLVNDAGIAQGPYAGAVAPGSSNPIQNSQCTVGLIGANGSGDTLTLTLAVTFKTAFAGNKILYLAAGDVSQNSSGWVPLGVWLWPAASQNTTTAVVTMTPASGTGLSPTPFTFVFSDTKGFADLGVENILINTALDGRHACYLAYARQINWLYIVNDAGNGLLPGTSLATSGRINNSQCTVSWGNNAVTVSGNDLRLVLNIGFSPGFGPNVIFYLAARDVNEANNTGWQSSGTWVVH
jgi:probable HAF family extracellular repeat protein